METRSRPLGGGKKKSAFCRGKGNGPKIRIAQKKNEELKGPPFGNLKPLPHNSRRKEGENGSGERIRKKNRHHPRQPGLHKPDHCDLKKKKGPLSQKDKPRGGGVVGEQKEGQGSFLRIDEMAPTKNPHQDG